ncbi:MAG: hypothetical protein KJ072_25310, partial [Verrucomicrobia bacterium]|nr:hypothetical protein [Verrucomicrobiota bacterium]
APRTLIVLENAHLRYTISGTGENLGFLNRATGTDHLQRAAPSPCAVVRRAGKDYPVTAATLEGDRLRLEFAPAQTAVTLKVHSRPSHIRLTVETIRGEPDELVFLNVPLTLAGKPSEPFAACAFSRNLITRVDRLPVLQNELRASCHRKFGLVGASVAIVAMPMPHILDALKEVLTEAPEMPLCRVAGPWAPEIPFNHGSYLFNFGALTESTVDDWIAMTRDLGFTQIDHHGGGAGFFRFGDFELNREKWPDGWDAYRRIVARLHEAGIGSIFHTYAFFIDKQSRYVTPVPDRRLDAFRTFTLAEAVAPDADELRVQESTSGLSTVTGFFEHNSVVLHLGDELITFGAVSQEPPWRFTQLKRGAFGTTRAAHPLNTQVRHLKECFGLFVPDPESPLFEEIAANHADIINQSDFDAVYLDAIDGSSILRGPDECWYWADKFVFEIQKRLRKPVGMEMSAMWHHFWQYRTRWQAWDYPQRGHQRFVDLHAESVHGGLLLPLHLGWWNFQSFNPPQIEPTYPDVIEQLGARLIGWDAGLSLTGAVDRDRLRNVPLFRRAVDQLRAFEELRHQGVFSQSVKAALREPGSEFKLFTDAEGKSRFRRSHSEPHTVSPAEPWTLAWQATNPFEPQPLRLRLEALMSTAAYDDPDAIVLADASLADAALWESRTADGVAVSFAAPASGTTPLTVTLTATNAGKVPRHAAWAKFTRTFDPPMNLKRHQALGLRVQGDARGQLVAVRLESPRHLTFGALADRYLDIDFNGSRTCYLLETESARWTEFVWNDQKSHYNVYRETIDFGAVESASIWLQNLPPGASVQCELGPVKALPMLPASFQNPALTVNGVTVLFPVELTSGSWIECNGPEDCVLYGSKGEMLTRFSPRPAIPMLKPGPNEISFSCASGSGPAPRVKITLFTQGEPLQD